MQYCLSSKFLKSRVLKIPLLSGGRCSGEHLSYKHGDVTPKSGRYTQVVVNSGSIVLEGKERERCISTIKGQ
jgi:hypothetical protein